MSEPTTPEPTGRRALITALAGLAAAAGLGGLSVTGSTSCGAAPPARSRKEPRVEPLSNQSASAQSASTQSASTQSARMPVIFLPHGGGPWPFVDVGFSRQEVNHLAAHLRELPALLARAPRALLVVSAHWEEAAPTLMTSPHPPMLYDYHGFPPESYSITWPAPGAPELAGRVRELLSAAGFAPRDDAARGFDHGTFIPLKVAFPEPSIPTLQLSLRRGLDPAEHLALGAALAPLRTEGVAIIGSGMTYHNLRALRDPRSRAASEEFHDWLDHVMTLEAPERDAQLVEWERAPAARLAHPREEHLLPVMIAAGAAGEDRGRVSYSGRFVGLRHSGFALG